MLDAIIESIGDERKEQDKKWGEQNHRPFHWLAILMEEVGEASRAIVEAFPHKHPITSYEEREWLIRYSNELIQVAAVAIAAIESLNRNELEGD